MAITLVGHTHIGSSAASLTLNFTGGNWSGGTLLPGDVVIIIPTVNFFSNSFTINTSGYTLVTTNPLTSNDSDAVSCIVAYKIMGSTPDTSVNVTSSFGSGLSFTLVAYVLRGVDTTTPIDTTTTTSIGNNATAPDNASITPVTSSSMVLAIATCGNRTSAVVFTEPTGYSDKKSASTNVSGFISNVAIARKAWSGSGAEDPAAWGVTNITALSAWACATISLRPSPSQNTTNFFQYF